MSAGKHPRQLAIERALDGVRRRLPELPYDRLLAARLMLHAHKHSQELSNAVLKAHDLSYVSYSVLMVLFGADGEGLSASELAQATGERPTNLTRVCDELQARKLILRQPCSDDRRRVLLRLSRSGEKLAERVQPQIWAVVERLYGSFTNAELRQLQALLGKQLLATAGQEQ
ncbi:MarR family winged helix-turn-helix transcriptional regulator [Solimonas terrae]|uniref:MarR family transcriptional regulator n=1 Tax=Solimonas terrae TaxID=1396819 RepID=A0A6M2BU59_9GAMM|nr:MarR family transcriptional regulator [Solimonas terrae]NGY05880.1 MarR family transcriptional regulator [Solimonas terrae]